MQQRKLGPTGLEIAPIVFGGNVFGWTADKKESFALLDAFVDRGFDAIDTADIYSTWVDGNTGGDSERVIGAWLATDPGKRERVKIFTKVGGEMAPGHKGLSATWIEQAVEGSLRRLGTDHIDLYFSHFPDGDTPHDETLRAYQRLIDAGKVRSIGASNYDAGQLHAARAAAEAAGVTPYSVVQPEYNLYDRGGFEGPLRALCLEEGLGVVTYYSLASGFLTGKYRSASDAKGRARGGKVGDYFNGKGERILAALDAVAERHESTQAAVALAWLIASKGVTAPIASATSVAHVETFSAAVALELTGDDMGQLDRAGA